MNLSYDYCLAIQGREIHGLRAKDGLRAQESLPEGCFVNNNIFNLDTFRASLKALQIKLSRKYALIPPKILATCSGIDSNKVNLKEALIQNGAREVLLLERPMAVSLGNDADIIKEKESAASKRRLYLLIDNGCIELAAMEGLKVTNQSYWSAELNVNKSLQMTSPGEVRALPFSQECLKGVSVTLETLIENGLSRDGFYLWHPEILSTPMSAFITNLPAVPATVSASCLLQGARIVMRDLKWFIQGS